MLELPTELVRAWQQHLAFLLAGSTILLAMGGISLWRRRRYQMLRVAREGQPDMLIFVPDSRGFIIGGSIIGVCLCAYAVSGMALLLVGLMVPMFVGALLGIFNLSTIPLFSADSQGISRHGIWRQYRLDWGTIDWVYGESQSMSTPARTTRRASATSEVRLILEAGPHRRLAIPLSRGDNRTGTALQLLIERHTPDALVGQRKAAAVRERRLRNQQVAVTNQH